MNTQKQFIVNLSASILAFIVNLGINFFLTPYIIHSIGVEAYGFVTLGSNLINYASLLTIALNSMASRFISIEIHRNNWEGANRYFTSVVIANIVAALLLLMPFLYFILNLEFFLNISSDLIWDVRLLFIFLLINFLISIIFSAFAVSTFATNKLYLKSMREIESLLLRAILLVALFVFFKPSVYYLSFSAFLVLIYVTYFNLRYMKRFLGKINVRRKYYEFKAIIEIIWAGIWNAVIQLGQILLQGLDLLISNLFISATAMGILAVTKTIPSLLLTLIVVVSNVFMPDFTKLFAQNKTMELHDSIKRSMKVLGIIINIPIAVFIAFGESFFKLWIPSGNSHELQAISVLSVITIIISGPINSIYGVFTVTNKIKVNAMILILTGIINIIVVLLLLEHTNLGLYAVVGVNAVLSTIRNLLFTAPFGARYLGLKWSAFFPEIIKSLGGCIIIVSMGLVLNEIISIENWFHLILCSSILLVVGLLVNTLIILNNSEKQYLINQIKRLGMSNGR